MSYISSLNLLNADSPIPMNEEAFQEELALWANAQFSFDTTPGSALLDDEHKEESLLDTLNTLHQFVQPMTPVQPIIQPGLIQKPLQPVYPAAHHLPRIAPAPGPLSGIQMMESKGIKKRGFSEDEDVSAEDDKRRRNTAASARFRLKKKMREQALEQKSSSLASNVEKLENKVKELEMEAKWLRALVLEKDPSLLEKSPLLEENSLEKPSSDQETESS